MKKKALRSGMFANDIKGDPHYGGVFEREDRKILKFKSLGCKRYVTLYEDELEITISGVAKDAGSKELEEKGGIENWNTETVFENSGNVNVYYNDNVNYVYTNEEGKKIWITDNIYVEKCDYKMKTNYDFEEILNNVNRIRRIYRQMNKSKL